MKMHQTLKSKEKNIFIIAGISFVLVIFVALVSLYNYKTSPVQRLLDKGYINQGKIRETSGSTCMAVSPECGQCLGVVIDGYCYVANGKTDINSANQ